MNLQNILSNVLRTNANNTDFLEKNNNFWTGVPKNFDLLLLKNSTNEFLFDYEKKYYDEKIMSDPKNRYFNKRVFYSIDNDGFRHYNLPLSNKQIHCFGCSCTFGVGLSDDETWPYMLSSKLNNEYLVKNFGTIGASSDTISRFIYQSQSSQPSIAVVLFPSMFRKEYITEEGRVMNFNVRSDSKNKDVHNSYYNKCQDAYSGYLNLLNNNESFFNFVKNFNLIKFALKNTPFVWGSLCRSFTYYNKHLLSRYIDVNNMVDVSNVHNLPNSYARDGEHYSYNYNEYIASKFYEFIIHNY